MISASDPEYLARRWIDAWNSHDLEYVYQNERGKVMREYLWLGSDGRIVQGSANYLVG